GEQPPLLRRCGCSPRLKRSVRLAYQIGTFSLPRSVKATSLTLVVSHLPCGFSTLVWQQHGQAPYQRARRSSMPTPQDVIARLYRAFNTRNFDAYAQCLTPDFQLRAKGGGSVRGVEACKGFDREWVSAFPDGHITMEKQVADASNVMAECRFVGTHTGAL